MTSYHCYTYDEIIITQNSNLFGFFFRLMNSLIVLVILCCGIQLSCGEKLKCLFKELPIVVDGTLYSCKVKSLDNQNNNMNVTGSKGQHMWNKNDNDVKAFWIRYTNTKFIPENLGLLFNVIFLNMESTQLVEIKAKDFKGMQDLEYMYLGNNHITSVPKDVFTTLMKIVIISLSNNQIEAIPRGLFDNNLKLKRVYFYNNKVKYIESGTFNGLENLIAVDLASNTCLNKEYNETAGIIQLKNDLKTNCININEVATTTTTLKLQEFSTSPTIRIGNT